MKVEIKHRWAGSVLFSAEVGSLKLAVEAAVRSGAFLKGAYLEGAYLKGAFLKGAYLKGAYLKGADLKGAYLKGADLNGADLKGAYLEGAYLEGAYLKGADLKGADLKGAYLKGADLNGADLKGAYLKGAYLEGAYLKGAYLKGALKPETVLPTGETWSRYLTETVPALLTAGGKTLKQVVESGCWDCHLWNNCPMAVAFDAHDSPDKVPVLLWPRRDQFVQLFDAKLIPVPKLPE